MSESNACEADFSVCLLIARRDTLLRFHLSAFFLYHRHTNTPKPTTELAVMPPITRFLEPFFPPPLESCEGAKVGECEAICLLVGPKVILAVGLAVGATEVLALTEGARVGDTQGKTLGLALGCTVGSTVGAVVGLTDGEIVGTALGVTVGTVDGTTVGLLELVGPAVLGILVGCADTVGAEVGLLLGWAEGCELGAFTVCSTVGTTVGW